MPTISTYPHSDADWATICAWIDANNPTLAAALAEGTPQQTALV